jgi:hypothetical protein
MRGYENWKKAGCDFESLLREKFQKSFPANLK